MRLPFAALLSWSACTLEQPSAPPAPAPASVPTGAPRPGTLYENLTLDVGGHRRTYHFYEAAGPAGTPRPLVVVLHGGGATIDAFVGRAGGAAPMAGAWLEVAAQQGLHVAIPQGVTAASKRQWNDCRSDCRHCGDQDDVAFILALVRSLSDRHAVDPDRIYVAGESNGGFMTLRLAEEHADVFAAFGSVIALMPANDECGGPRSPASIAFVVGTDDKAVKYAGGMSSNVPSGSVLSAADSVAAWLAAGGCDTRPTTEPLPDLDPKDGSTVTLMRHACSRTGHEILLYRVDGGGHVVPSIEQRVSRI